MSQRPSVLFIDHTAVMAGGERSLLAVAENLLDWDVSVVLGAEGSLAEALRAAGIDIRVNAIGLPRLTDIGRRTSGPMASLAAAVGLLHWSWSLRRELRRSRPDVIVANSLKAGMATWLATRGSTVAFVWSIRDRLTADYLGPLPRRVLHHVMAHGPCRVIANSAATAATCTAAPKVTVIPPSIAPLDVAPPVSDTPVIFAVFSRLAPWKGQDLAIRAFARAFDDGDAELRIIGGALFGETEYALDLEHLVAKRELGDRVTFTGHVDDVAHALDGVHVAVLPSVVPEPFGRSLVEAMGAGIPVIASNVGGPAEIIRDGVDGVLVPIDDEAALAEAMSSLTDPARRATLIAAGRRTAQTYEPSRLAPLWSTALEQSAAR